MSEFTERFEVYLQSHVHPDVQPAARRLTHVKLGSMSMQAFLDVAEVIQASHEAFDRDLDEGGAQVGWTPEGEFVDNHAQVIERTPLAQADFDRRVQ